MFQNDDFDNFDIRSVCLGSRGIGSDIDSNVDGGGRGCGSTGQCTVSPTTQCSTGATGAADTADAVGWGMVGQI